jgi:AcrR family transcriptional regulator
MANTGTRRAGRLSGTRRAGRPSRVSREMVLRAALDLADRGGLEAVTMREVGRAVGVEAMSLYRHVEDKDDVLSGIVDLVFAEIELPSDATAWRAFLRARAISTRTVLGRHPWAIGLLDAQARPGPANLRHHDRVLGALLGAGFSSRTATHAYSLLDSYVYGFVLQERSMPVGTPEGAAESAEAILARMPGELYPNLTAVGRELVEAGFDYGNEFELGLDVVLDGIERIRLDR